MHGLSPSEASTLRYLLEQEIKDNLVTKEKLLAVLQVVHEAENFLLKHQNLRGVVGDPVPTVNDFLLKIRKIVDE